MVYRSGRSERPPWLLARGTPPEPVRSDGGTGARASRRKPLQLSADRRRQPLPRRSGVYRPQPIVCHPSRYCARGSPCSGWNSNSAKRPFFSEKSDLVPAHEANIRKISEFQGGPIRTPAYAPWHRSSRHFYAEVVGTAEMIVGALRPRSGLRRALLASTALASTAVDNGPGRGGAPTGDGTGCHLAAPIPAPATTAPVPTGDSGRCRPGTAFFGTSEHHQRCRFRPISPRSAAGPSTRARRPTASQTPSNLDLHFNGAGIAVNGGSATVHQQRLADLHQVGLGQQRDHHQQRLPVFRQIPAPSAAQPSPAAAT